MGRKRKNKGFQWIRDDQPDADAQRAQVVPEKSRTQLRDEARALDDFGETLLGLAPARFARLPVSDDLRAAIEAARAMTSHEARRRQIQLIGRLLRDEDVDEIRNTIEDTGAAARDRRAARWTTRILADGDAAIDAYLQANPAALRQRLRQLWRAADRDPKKSGDLTSYVRKMIALEDDSA
ncbi:MAG: ribosome biogenesis factor YjgA [Myxococcota bacterium]